MIADTALALVRAAHFGALMALFGGAVFPIYAGAKGAAPRWALWLALPSGLIWFAGVVINVGGSGGSLFDTRLIATIFTQADFGRAWALHLLLTLACVTLVLRGDAIVGALSGLALVTLAGIGHAAITEGLGGVAHQANHALHLLACGVWLGALAPLSRALRDLPLAEAERVTARFSRVAYVSVALIAASGVVNTWFVTGAVAPNLAIPYGRWLTAKLVAVTLLLGLAAHNRFALSRPLLAAKLTQNIAMEHALFALILLLVGYLGLSAPRMMM
jgi:copper resistance protein D